MSKEFREYANNRNKQVSSISDIQSRITDNQLNSLVNIIVESNLFMIAHELDRLCDILERKQQ